MLRLLQYIGVIEHVPVNTPTSWCSRMVITPKHDGTPRRVVDFQSVNSHCQRQTHHTKSPWQIASAVPPALLHEGEGVELCLAVPGEAPRDLFQDWRERFAGQADARNLEGGFWRL